MRDGASVEQNGVLDFTRIADDAIIANDDEVTDVGVVADFAILPDDGRPLDHRAVFHHGALADENVFPDEGFAIATITQVRARVGGNVFLQLLQRVPRKLAVSEKRAMLRFAEIKQI